MKKEEKEMEREQETVVEGYHHCGYLFGGVGCERPCVVCGVCCVAASGDFE